jgi:16S rRNA (guanine(1405)-N(7))-methyltransferase
MKVEEIHIQEILASILDARKYRGLGLNADTIKDVIRNEAPNCKSYKHLQKAVKRKLHNIIAPYLGNPDYLALAEELVSIKNPSLDSPQIRAFCLNTLSGHASTAERVPNMTQFYAGLFGKTGTPETILDMACGLHPLAIPWMGLPDSIDYYAYDIVQPRIDFINLFFSTIGLKPHAENRDILVNPPQIQADVGLLFKEAHRMEKRNPGCNREFWASLKVDCLAVSLPVHDLSRTHSLVKKHRQLVQENLPDHSEVEELHFEDELIFLIRKPDKKRTA